MKIALYCEFEEETANGILMRGRARALAELGHRVFLAYQPFKFHSRRPSRTLCHSPNFIQRDCYSPFFGSPIWKKILFLPALKLQTIGLFLALRRSDVAILHKALPLSLFYLLLLRMTFYRGKAVLILDDWEGVGGFASLRNRDRLFNRMLVTLTEEWTPLLADGVWCVSKILFDKMKLSRRTAGRSLYLPNGGEAPDSPPRPKAADDGAPVTVGYVGTFKNPWLVDFLLSMVKHSRDRFGGRVRFKFVGGGDLFPLLSERRYREDLSSTMELMGQIPSSRVREQIDAMDITLLILNHEFPDAYIDASRSSVKMFEYMSRAKVVLASAFGEPRQIIRDGQNGYLVRNDPEAFADKLEWLLSHRNGWATVGRAAQKDFEEHYTHKVLMTRMLDWALNL